MYSSEYSIAPTMTSNCELSIVWLARPSNRILMLSSRCLYGITKLSLVLMMTAPGDWKGYSCPDLR
jgi:hypothetical protein